MPRRGENIRKRKDGRWEGRYYAVELETGKSIQRSVYARSYGEVKGIAMVRNSISAKQQRNGFPMSAVRKSMLLIQNIT